MGLMECAARVISMPGPEDGEMMIFSKGELTKVD